MQPKINNLDLCATCTNSSGINFVVKFREEPTICLLPCCDPSYIYTCIKVVLRTHQLHTHASSTTISDLLHAETS